MKKVLLNIISDSLDKSDLSEIRKDFSVLLVSVKRITTKNIVLENGFASVSKDFLIGEINQILVTQTIERMLGVVNKQYVDKFVFGLFPSGMASLAEIISVASLSGFLMAISGILIYLFRNKKKETK